jgi:CRISPR/Cas system-associated exonuclease Cas4 (RecB family)
MTSINFDKVIDDYLSSERKRKNRKRNIKVFYPSELTFPCLRGQYLKYTQPEIPVSPKTQRIFKIGTIIHDFIQDSFKKANSEFSLLDLEASIQGAYSASGDLIRIRGRADAIIERNGEEYIVELKSVAPQPYRDDVFRFLNEPKESHLKQILWYMQSANIKKGVIIYIEKVGAETKTFTISLDDYSTQQSITETAKELYKHLKTGTIPPRETNHWNNKICNYCQYYEACENDNLVANEPEN